MALPEFQPLVEGSVVEVSILVWGSASALILVGLVISAYQYRRLTVTNDPRIIRRVENLATMMRWSAVFLGFLGMLLIVQPAFTDLNYFYITPIIFCIGFACVAISVRSLSKTEANYTIAFYFTLLCTLLGLSTVFFSDWAMPTPLDFLLFFILGLCGSIANLLLTQSYRLAEASLVTPIKYLSLVFAIIFGFFIWSEVPKILTLLGAALVIASSLIIFMRENKLKKQIITTRT